MKINGKRGPTELKPKVALETIPGDLMLAEPDTKHGRHHMMIAAWKRHAIERM